MRDRRHELPPKPEKPLPEDCCGSGCSPCILELYEEELENWRKRVRALRESPRDDTFTDQ